MIAEALPLILLVLLGAVVVALLLIAQRVQRLELRQDSADERQTRTDRRLSRLEGVEPEDRPVVH